MTSFCVALLSDETPPEPRPGQTCCCETQEACWDALVEASGRLFEQNLPYQEKIARLSRGKALHGGLDDEARSA